MSPIEEELDQGGIKFAPLYVTRHIVEHEEHVQMRIPQDLLVGHQAQIQRLHLIRILGNLIHLITAQIRHLLLRNLPLQHHLPQRRLVPHI